MKHRIVPMVALLLTMTPLLSGSADPEDGSVGGAAGTPSLESPSPEAAAPPSNLITSGTHPTLGDVIFPHDEHVSDLEIGCEECHHEINAAELVTPHDEYFEDFWIQCQVCHNGSGAGDRGPEACSNCHHSHLAGHRDQTLSTKVVVHELCWSCHESGTGVEASKSCQKCHTGAQ